jgi:hypothetical protein
VCVFSLFQTNSVIVPWIQPCSLLSTFNSSLISVIPSVNIT